MGNKNKKKMNLTSILRSSTTGLLSIPLCYNNANKTLSFRHHNNNNDIVKTVNSIFFDNHNDKDFLEIETPESWFTSETTTSSHHSATTESDSDKSLETVVRGVIRSSDRLFFDPTVTSCKLDQTKKQNNKLIDQKQSIEEISVAVAMESEDPYSDFRRSMEEMVMSHGELVQDWESLESMLAWYLKMNVKKSHGVIVSAFVDLLAGISGGRGGVGTSSSESARYSTAVSSSLPSSPLFFHGSSSHEIEEEDEEEEEERRSV